MPYLVDGNNLAHALGLKTAGQPDREACARAVAAFCRAQGAAATVVFDGPAPLGAGPSLQGHRLRVVYGEGVSADELILKQLAASATPGDFIVVTSDKSLGDRARHRRARVLRSHEFARKLAPPGGQAGPAPEKPSVRETAAEIEAWLAAFARRS